MSNPSWNAGRAVGPRTAFTHAEVTLLIERLQKAGAFHDLALLTTGIDTMLRASDLLRLRVRDVTRVDESIREHLVWRQRKTGSNVSPVLTPTSRYWLKHWIEVNGKRQTDFLFTGMKPRDAAPLTASTWRRKVKTWAVMIGLDPAEYSSHSIRRTKAVFMYREGCGIADISKLLGHRSTEVTLHYLGITAEHLRAQALKYDVFDGQAKSH